MPSLFPGMNPYLERDTVWNGFHESFIPYAQESLSAQVNPHFIVKIDEHIYIHELPEIRGRLAGPDDVGVAEIASPNSGASAAVIEAPAQVRLPQVDVQRVSYLEIRDREDWKLVTAIELLSPSNKYAGPDRDQYLAKRTTLLQTTAHFIEIDLLRGGPRLPLEDLPECDYYALVSRYEKRPEADLWPMQLREPLPIIPIPLCDSHPDAQLDLKAILDRVYDASGFAHYIYRRPVEPRLSAGDAEWAKQFIPGE